MKIEATPAHVIQPILWNVLILASAMTATVAKNDHHTEQAACSERALMAIETPRIPDPLTKTKLPMDISKL